MKITLTKDREIEFREPEMLQFVSQQSVGVSKVDVDTKSGNPRHDVFSGRFGSGKKVRQRVATPPNVDREQFMRRRDAVIDAARTNPAMDADELARFLEGRVNRAPSVEELEALLRDVRVATLNDLTDFLHAEIGTRRGNINLRVPKVWLNETYDVLSDAELQVVANRLVTRGWDSSTAAKATFKRLRDKDRRDSLVRAFGG